MNANPTPAARRATMIDVASAAGVSLKTVSRVINREGGVKESTAQRVRGVAAELGYRHNLSASNLRRGQRTSSIGVLLQDLSNDFCGELLRAIEVRARDRGVVVISASLDDEPDRERELVSGLVSRRCDGLILMPASAEVSYLRQEVDAGLAVVLVDRGAGFSLDSVTVDNRGGAATATRHLIAQGHRRVAAVVDDLGIETAVERLEGYRDVMRERGNAAPELEVTGVRTPEEAQAAVRGLLAQPDPPTALFAGRNVITIGAVRALRQAGRQHEVAMVGFDDFATADLLEPGVTTLRQNAMREGELAFDLLKARLDGSASPPRSLVLEADLVLRGSGELPGPGRRALAADPGDSRGAGARR